MARRHLAWIAAVVVTVGGLVWPAVSAGAASWAPWAAPHPVASYLRVVRHPAVTRGARFSAGSRSFAACEARLEAAPREADRSETGGRGADRSETSGREAGRGGTGRRVPVLAVVGASFTAGVGPDNPVKSWAVLVARMLRWDAVVYGDPGAGYVNAGEGRRGPVAAELRRIGLRALSPELVIVQAGHDDIGVPARVEERRVADAVDLIRAEAPQARIALITVFTGRGRSKAAYATDRAIVAAATAADRSVIIMDPLASGWTFPRSPGGLHPTAAGSRWIAGTVAGILRQHGVQPASAAAAAAAAAGTAGTAGTLICDSGIRAPAPTAR